MRLESLPVNTPPNNQRRPVETVGMIIVNVICAIATIGILGIPIAMLWMIETNFNR